MNMTHPDRGPSKMIADPIFAPQIPAALAGSWERLCAQSATPSFQYDLAYQGAWLELLAGDWKPLLLSVKDSGDVRGIFPLMYRDRRRRGIMPYREIRFLGHEVTDFSVVLARPADAKSVVHAALDWLFSGAFRWEWLRLDDIPEDNPAAGAIGNWLQGRGIPFMLDTGKYYYIPLDREWDEVWGATSRKFVRRNVNLARNRLARSGSWRLVADPDWDTGRIIEEAVAIHQPRQVQLSRESAYSNPDYRRFAERVLACNRDASRLRSHWLEAEGRLIAYLLGFEQDGVYYAWNMAFQPAFAEYYPSRLVFAEVVKECHDKGLREFNFMRGEAEYKAKWTPYFRGNLRFTVRNTGHFYGRLVHALEGRVRAAA